MSLQLSRHFTGSLGRRAFISVRKLKKESKGDKIYTGLVFTSQSSVFQPLFCVGTPTYEIWYKTNRQLAGHGDYSSTVNCRKKIPLCLSRDNLHFSRYLKMFFTYSRTFRENPKYVLWNSGWVTPSYVINICYSVRNKILKKFTWKWDMI